MEHIDTDIVKLNECTKMNKLCAKLISRIKRNYCASNPDEIKRLALKFAVKYNFSEEELNYLTTYITNDFVKECEPEKVTIVDMRMFMILFEILYLFRH